MSPMRAPERRLAPTLADSRFELVSEFQPKRLTLLRPRTGEAAVSTRVFRQPAGPAAPAGRVAPSAPNAHAD